MLFNTYLQPDNTARLLRLLQAARPFLTPSWCSLADLCIRFLTIFEFAANPQRYNLQRLFFDARSCNPTDNMDALLGAIRPFCLEEELKLLQMFEQFQQMQKAMDLWKMFSDLAPDFMQDTDIPPDFMQNANIPPFTDHTQDILPAESDSSNTSAIHNSVTTDTSFLAFLSPEQRALYNNILAEDDCDEPTLPA